MANRLYSRVVEITYWRACERFSELTVAGAMKNQVAKVSCRFFLFSRQTLLSHLAKDHKETDKTPYRLYFLVPIGLHNLYLNQVNRQKVNAVMTATLNNVNVLCLLIL